MAMITVTDDQLDALIDASDKAIQNPPSWVHDLSAFVWARRDEVRAALILLDTPTASGSGLFELDDDSNLAESMAYYGIIEI